MGRPLIDKIAGVVSTYHLAMTYTTNEGRSTKLRGSQKKAQQCYITSLKQPARIRQQPISKLRSLEQLERKSRKRKREEYRREKDKQKLAMENFEPAKKEMARPFPSGEHVTVELTKGDPSRTVKIGKDIDPVVGVHLIELLRKNKDIFAFSADKMPGIDPAIMVHRLNVRGDIKPVRQKNRSFSTEKNQAIQEDVEKLLEVGFIKPCDYPEWLANVVMVKKANGYHQISLHNPNRQKTAFITEGGVYNYIAMPFGLKNAGATFQKTM
ncbi:uncharacterized protein LOC110725997 [Chenopodium quinoa]|uniref:uncharacterized protein LOC110725997 n=1 Tax=Chenopodium quinoa TaxID=63459 RepID=UPI000B77931B|nr:uncharacterized protein LOC110725997 [Chenopodium quinoa]